MRAALALLCVPIITSFSLPSCHRPSPPARARRIVAVSSTADALFVDAYAEQLPQWLVVRAALLGFKQPTPVQACALGPVLSGTDAVILAQTGSGKTLAYLLPLLAALRPASSVQAIVLLPTRELASQVAQIARRLAAGSPERLLVMALLDGSGARRQRRWIVAQPPQLVVGNVQQVDSLLKAGLLQLGSLRMLVIDEVDACLADVDTREALNGLLASHLALPLDERRSGSAGGDTRRVGGSGGSGSGRRGNSDDGGGSVGGSRVARQTLFVSASLPQRQHFLRQSLQKRWCATEPVLLHAEPEAPTPPQLRHLVAVCLPAKRVAALRLLLRRHAPSVSAAIVFVKPTRPLQRIADALAGCIDESPPALLSEGLNLVQRAEALRAFREGKRRLLISTPLGARGLDVEQCSHVYLFDVPAGADEYLHAAGRCGRMGRPGVVTTLCPQKELFVMRRVSNTLGIQLEDAREAAAAPERDRSMAEPQLGSRCDADAQRDRSRDTETSDSGGR